LHINDDMQLVSGNVLGLLEPKIATNNE